MASFLPPEDTMRTSGTLGGSALVNEAEKHKRLARLLVAATPLSPPESACPSPRCHCIVLWASRPPPWPSPVSRTLWAESPGSGRSLCSHPGDTDKAFRFVPAHGRTNWLATGVCRVKRMNDMQLATQQRARQQDLTVRAALLRFRANSDLGLQPSSAGQWEKFH